MLEYPEIKTIAGQAEELLIGKTIKTANLLTPEKKFVFCPSTPEEFSNQLEGTTLSSVSSCGNHLFLTTRNGMALNIGDTGGKMLSHESEETIPKKRDVQVDFTDGTFFTHSVTMWGFIEVLTGEKMDTRIKRIKDEAREPVRSEVTADHFVDFVAKWDEAPKINAKKLIVSRKYFTGLGNGYTQDILWRSRIHPRRKMDSLTEAELRGLFDAFLDVVEEATAAGGRTTERDLLNNPGGFEPVMYRSNLGKPCPVCGINIEKFAFEGGACYVCPGCQVPVS